MSVSSVLPGAIEMKRLLSHDVDISPIESRKSMFKYVFILISLSMYGHIIAVTAQFKCFIRDYIFIMYITIII